MNVSSLVTFFLLANVDQILPFLYPAQVTILRETSQIADVYGTQNSITLFWDT